MYFLIIPIIQMHLIILISQISRLNHIRYATLILKKKVCNNLYLEKVQIHITLYE